MTGKRVSTYKPARMGQDKDIHCPRLPVAPGVIAGGFYFLQDSEFSPIVKKQAVNGLLGKIGREIMRKLIIIIAFVLFGMLANSAIAGGPPKHDSDQEIVTVPLSGKSFDCSFLNVSDEEKIAQLEIKIDTNISQVMEYFEIFLSRMLVCKRAAEYLGLNFALVINDNKLL